MFYLPMIPGNNKFKLLLVMSDDFAKYDCNSQLFFELCIKQLEHTNNGFSTKTYFLNEMLLFVYPIFSMTVTLYYIPT